MEPESSETSPNFGQLVRKLTTDQLKRSVRQIEAINQKITNAETALSFNLVCLRENILPGYTNIRLHDESARNEDNTRRFRMELVERQIQEKKKIIQQLQHEKKVLTEEWAKATVEENLRLQINRSLQVLQDKHRKGVESTNIRKLAKLYGGDIKMPRRTTGYINLTDIDLTPEQEELLNMGLNCHYLSKPPPNRKRLEIEVLLDDIQKLEKEKKIVTTPHLQPALLAEATKTRGSHFSKIINKDHIQAAKQLKNNKDIVIRRADKTAAFVIISKEEYTQKINDILSDTSKFKRITRNPTDNIKKKLNKIISTINAVPNNYKFQKLTGEYSPGYAYGNVKTHKPGNPLRPIISQIPAATYTTAKRLNEILTPYVPKTYSLSSATDFLEILRDAPTTEDHIIASLDVESLFTNVPVDETITFILDRVYRCNETRPLNIPEHALRSLLEICTKEAPFVCPNGRMYQQIDGIAMGSPLGVLFGNFYMGTIESRLLDSDRPSIYCRYIDDIFVRVKNISELQNLRQRFVTGSKLNFTYEETNNGQLPFLDVLITAENAGFKTCVYTKPTNLGMCLNGNSECPRRYLRSTISAYVRRALSHCSTWEDTHQELERATQVLINNGYSNTEVSTIIKAYIDKWYSQTGTTTSTDQQINLYYRNYMSTQYRADEKTIKDIVSKNVRPTEPTQKINLIIYYKTKKTANLLLRNRPDANKNHLQEDHVIYEHNCNNEECGPHSYIGMTRTKLTRRLTCHLQSGAIKTHYSNQYHSALTRQDLENKTTIIDKEQDPRRLAFLEAIYIINKQPTMNTQIEDFQILPSTKHYTRTDSQTVTHTAAGQGQVTESTTANQRP